jgi:repressor LexA
MESQLTPKQKIILEWIEQYLKQYHTMPSRREIALGLGLSSPATIQQHIEALEKKGFLKRGDAAHGRSENRALQWTARSKKVLSAISSTSMSNRLENQGPQNVTAITSASPGISFEIPLLGTIAAGYPIEVYPDVRHVNVPLELFISPKQAALTQKDIYMLTVRGDSMIDEGIFQDDWVILRKSTQAKSGDTVAALWNGEATLKKFFKTKSGMELHPANPKYPVMSIAPDDRFEIQGVLIGVIRRFGQPV